MKRIKFELPVYTLRELSEILKERFQEYVREDPREAALVFLEGFPAMEYEHLGEYLKQVFFELEDLGDLTPCLVCQQENSKEPVWLWGGVTCTPVSLPRSVEDVDPPDWDNVPHDANWCVVDHLGELRCHALEPSLHQLDPKDHVFKRPKERTS